MTPKAVTDLVKESNLRGRGGAGFGTGMKWSFVPLDAPKPKYLIANADEMEPGTFKDRILLESTPHQLIEGMILAAFAIQAEYPISILRWAYKVRGASNNESSGMKPMKPGIWARTFWDPDMIWKCIYTLALVATCVVKKLPC